MNDNSRDPRDQVREPDDVQLPNEILNQQSLAVDLARADIDQQIATAHRYPRVLDTVIKKITTMACYNEEAAENCVYSLPRGGKPIIGPSIGFANITATAWGNCIDGSRWVATDLVNKVVIAEGLFHDLETNRRTIISEQRRIVGKNGALYNDDMRIVTSKAAGAIARRNAILQIVPRSIWHPIWEQALHIVRGTAETFSERKDKALKAFAQFGVKPEQVYMVLGLKGDPDLNLEHIPVLRGMYAALRDQSTTVEEMFDPRRATGAAFERVASPLADDEPGDDQVQAAQPGSSQSHDPQTGEVRDNAGAGQGQDQSGPGAKQPRKRDRERAAARAAKDGAAPKPAATQPDAGKPAAADAAKPSAAKPGPAQDKPPTDQGGDSLPTDCAGYVAYASKWIGEATSPTAIDERWRSERELRGTCGVIEDEFERVRKIKDARIAELKKG